MRFFALAFIAGWGLRHVGAWVCREDFGGGGGRSNTPYFQPSFLQNPWQRLEQACGLPVSPSLQPVASAVRAVSGVTASPTADRVTLSDLFEGGGSDADAAVDDSDAVGDESDDGAGLDGDGDVAEDSVDAGNDDDDDDREPTVADGSAAPSDGNAEDEADDTEATRQRWKALLSRRKADAPSD